MLTPREALDQIRALCEALGADPDLPAGKVEAILDRVQPDQGISLSAEEAAVARGWYTRLPIGVTVDDVALAQRLDRA